MEAVNEYIIKTTGFSPVFCVENMTTYAMVFIPKRKTVFYWDFNINI